MLVYCKWISWQEFEKEIAIVNHKRQNERVILEYVSKDIWKMIGEGKSKDEMVKGLVEKYENAERLEVEKDIESVLRKLISLEVIEEKSGNI